MGPAQYQGLWRRARTSRFLVSRPEARRGSPHHVARSRGLFAKVISQSGPLHSGSRPRIGLTKYEPVATAPAARSRPRRSRACGRPMQHAPRRRQRVLGSRLPVSVWTDSDKRWRPAPSSLPGHARRCDFARCPSWSGDPPRGQTVRGHLREQQRTRPLPTMNCSAADQLLRETLGTTRTTTSTSQRTRSPATRRLWFGTAGFREPRSSRTPCSLAPNSLCATVSRP